MNASFDLGEYFRRVPDMLMERYKTTFDDGFREIRQRYAPVSAGARLLTVDDVLAIFDDGLPFVNDWTKPDREELERKMNRGPKPVAALIKELRSADYKHECIVGIVNGFRELTLTALVLHHVYPDRFAMCSHHIASQLYVTGTTVPDFYIAYCRELREWAKHPWRTRGIQTVVDAELALWSWYRLAHSQGKVDRERANSFLRDEWIQERRAKRIAAALSAIDPVSLARSYLTTDPTVAALIAWRELEVAVRERLGSKAQAKSTFHELLEKLPPDAFPPGMSRHDFISLWGQRNAATHEGATVTEAEAKRIVDGVAAFIMKNFVDG